MDRNKMKKIGALLILLTAALLLLPVLPVKGDDEAEVAMLRKQAKVFAKTAREVKEGVVFVKVEKTVKVSGQLQYGDPSQLFNDDLFERFFGHMNPGRQPQQQYRQEGQGSGFIISSDGYILTNNHVVGDADEITVKLNDGRELKAKVVGTDPHTDVAVIKVDADNLHALPVGDSDSLEVGEWVMAVGNPFGLTQTVTVGVVSAKGRSGMGIVDYEDFIQTDAAINPGNSGGPLLSLDGKVVGMNTAIFSKSGGYMGIGFAIPVNMVLKVYHQLRDNGSISRGYLGVVIQDLNSDLAKSFRLDENEGVLVSQVAKDSAAEKAGLEVGDVIVHLDGTQVKNVGSFRNRIALSSPGTKHKLGVIRNGKEIDISVKLGKLDKNTLASGTPAETKSMLGLTVQNLTADLAERYGYESESGVIISEVEQGSAAARAGLAPGVLITEVDKKPVKNVREFHNAVSKGLKDNKTVLLLVRQEGYSRFVVIRAE